MYPERALLNYSRPEVVTEGSPVTANQHGYIGPYSSGFLHINPRFNKIRSITDILTVRTDIGPEAYALLTSKWIELGTRTIGGWCEISPAHIAAMVRTLKPGVEPKHLNKW